MLSDSVTQLIVEIDAFLKKHDMKHQTLGRLMFNNQHLVRRIREGKHAPSMPRGDEIKDFMRNYKQPKKTKKKTESNLQQSAA